MRVLLTGATGLLGGAVLDLLLSNDHEVRCLVRPGSPNLSRLDPSRVEIPRGDANSAPDLGRALAGADALVHVAGIEHAPAAVEAVREAGVRRLVMVGSTSAHSSFEFRSGPKKEMEAVVRGSGLEWTIVRPSMIYGSERDKNVHRLLRFLNRSPVFPIFGPGTNLWQPVYHEDCARGLYEALVRSSSIGRSYDLPGAEPLEYRDLVLAAARALGKDPRIIHLPLGPVERSLAVAEKLRIPLPVKSEQVLRMREDKAYPFDDARKDLGYSPRPFEDGVALEVDRLRKIGVLH